MPNDPLNDPLLRSPRSFVPTIPAMTEAAAAATPEQLADFVDAIGAAGGGGGGGGGGGNATNLGVVASPTGVTVTSDSGTDAVLPLSDGTNAGLMAPAQHTKLGALPTAAALATALDGKATKAASGTVGASAVTISLSDALLAGVPLTITVTPESTCTVLVESSSDNGSTYTTVGSAVGVFEQWEYDRAPGETGWITNLRFTRTAGTATTSTYSIRS